MLRKKLADWVPQTGRNSQVPVAFWVGHPTAELAPVVVRDRFAQARVALHVIEFMRLRSILRAMRPFRLSALPHS
jgi:hypothetical protein